MLSAAWERENGMKENSEIKGIPFKSKQLYLSERESAGPIVDDEGSLFQQH